MYARKPGQPFWDSTKRPVLESWCCWLGRTAWTVEETYTPMTARYLWLPGCELRRLKRSQDDSTRKRLVQTMRALLMSRRPESIEDAWLC